MKNPSEMEPCSSDSFFSAASYVHGMRRAAVLPAAGTGTVPAPERCSHRNGARTGTERAHPCIGGDPTAIGKATAPQGLLVAHGETLRPWDGAGCRLPPAPPTARFWTAERAARRPPHPLREHDFAVLESKIFDPPHSNFPECLGAKDRFRPSRMVIRGTTPLGGGTGRNQHSARYRARKSLSDDRNMILEGVWEIDESDTFPRSGDRAAPF